MKLLALAVFDKGSETKTIHFVHDLSQFYFFQRETIRQYCLFGMRTLAERSTAHTKQSIDGETDFKVAAMFYTWSSDKFVACAITDKEYPKSSIYVCLRHCLIAGKSSEIENLFATFQDPSQGDKLFKIEQQLQEVKTVMAENITLVLQRGETLDSLIEKSQDLSKNAKLFGKEAKKLNACCKSW